MAGSLKVLLVEDNAQIKEIYTAVLDSENHTVETADTVDELLAKVKDFKPDVILLDIMLPGNMTGLDALKILRTDEGYDCLNTPIIILTNLGENDEIRQIWEKYANGYVIKAEIDPFEIINIIDSLDISAEASADSAPD